MQKLDAKNDERGDAFAALGELPAASALAISAAAGQVQAVRVGSGHGDSGAGRMAGGMTFSLDAACAEAAERLHRSLNRSVAQHRAHVIRAARKGGK